MTATASIALHPESVDGDPLEARWVVPAGTLTFVGDVRAAPAALQGLIDAGVVASVVVEPTGIRTRLGPGRHWRGDGGAVRDAVTSAAGAPDEWVPADPAGGDAVLRAAVEEVLAGEVGAYVRSHGGALELVGVADGRVQMTFSGACAHCPASDYTLTHRFESAVRARYPGVAGIDTTRSVSAPDAGRPRLIGFPRLRTR